MTQEVMKFPCNWPVKAFGPATEAFELAVVTIVRRHAGDIHENAVSCRPSRGGKYQAVTVTIQARDRAQLEALYAELRTLPELVMVL